MTWERIVRGALFWLLAGVVVGLVVVAILHLFGPIDAPAAPPPTPPVTITSQCIDGYRVFTNGTTIDAEPNPACPPEGR